MKRLDVLKATGDVRKEINEMVAKETIKVSRKTIGAIAKTPEF